VQVQVQAEPQPSSAGPLPPCLGRNDGDVIQNTAAAPVQPGQPALAQRSYASDPTAISFIPLR